MYRWIPTLLYTECTYSIVVQDGRWYCNVHAGLHLDDFADAPFHLGYSEEEREDEEPAAKKQK